MLGGMLLTAEWLTTGGRLGLAMSAVSAVEQAKRRLWISTAFEGAHPEEVKVVRQAIGGTDSRWRTCSKDLLIFANGFVITSS